MSSLKVEIVKIDKVEKHSNADKLDIAFIGGWPCIVSKNSFKEGDLGLYFPVDSILPNEIEARIFGPDSKIKLHHCRVKTIKIRGQISQGLLVHPDLFNLQDLPLGSDVATQLGVTKYEPPVRGSGTNIQTGKKARKTNSNFHKYTKIENWKWYTRVFQDGEPVVAHEKIHGSNWRAGYVPVIIDTFWKRILNFFNLLPKYEFVYGSHNVQLQNKIFWTGYYDSNVYLKIVNQYKIREVLKPGEVIYGEVYGDGIQKSYTYGCKQGEHKLAVFDVQIDGNYLDYADLNSFLTSTKLPGVPVLYEGPYKEEVVKSFVDGDSVLSPTQKIREGLVLRPVREQTCIAGRKILKLISDSYLLEDPTDFH